MFKRLLDVFAKKPQRQAGKQAIDVSIRELSEAAKRTSLEFARAILATKDEPGASDESSSSFRSTDAAARLFPDARSRVGLAFATRIARRSPVATPSDDATPAERREWIYSKLCDVFTLFAIEAALDFARARKSGSIKDTLSELDPDVLLFEVAAWFLGAVQTYLRRSPEVPDRSRPLVGDLFSKSLDELGSIFEYDGEFANAQRLLRGRVQAYQNEGAQSHLEFFLAAIGEHRGRSYPAEKIQGSFVFPSWEEGVFSQSVLRYSAIIKGARESTVFDLVKMTVTESA